MFGHHRSVSAPQDPENLVLQPRNVTFDWTDLPTHWVPDQPLVTHTCNVLHLLLPAGERWFIDVFTQVLPTRAELLEYAPAGAAVYCCAPLTTMANVRRDRLASAAAAVHFERSPHRPSWAVRPSR
ncbi:MAG: metal-dependent hydrolase [Pseudonocardiales bacterium]|nr:metal-dependent hydrolase [Pseudonocardiales bacterium]